MELPPAVWVAVIGAVASVAAAVFAVVAANRSARVKADADAMIERFKADDARRRLAFEVATREAEPLTVALTQVWHDIQTVRDVIQKSTAAALYDEGLAVTTLRSAVASIAEGYGRYGGMVPAQARLAWHDAKGRAVVIEVLMLQRGTAAQPKSDAAPDIGERLMAIRSLLRDDQEVLQQAMLSVRAEMMNRILATMSLEGSTGSQVV